MQTIQSTKPRMSLDKERELLARYQKGTRRARDKIRMIFIQTYGSCILKWAWRYERRLGLEVAIAAALEGFIISLDKVNLNRPGRARLTTIAYYWVRNCLIRTNLREGFEIRIPVHVYEAIKRLSLDNVRVEDLRQGRSKQSDKEQKMLLTLFQQHFSLESLCTQLGIVLKLEPEQDLEEIERDIDIRKAISRLPKHLRMVINGYYYESITLEVLADRMAVSRTTIQNYLEQALESLKGQLADYDQLQKPSVVQPLAG